MKIKKNINKFFFVLNEVKENVDEDLTLSQLIDATNSLIRLTKEEYIDKSFLKNYDNDNRKPLDKIFTCDEKFLPIDIGCKKFCEQDRMEASAFRDFKILNNGGELT